MDRKWMAAAAVSAAFWTFALLSAPLAAFCFPGRAEGVRSAGAVSPAPESTPAAGTSSAPTPPPPEDPSPAPTQTPSPAAEDGQLRSFTDESPARVRNFTSYDVDLGALEAETLPQRLPSEGPQILILHTHGTEAYLPVSGEEYQASDPYRTTDAAHSVIRVGDVLCAALEAQGLTVIHDRGLYDYPSYTGSYARSQEAAEGWLARYPGIGIVIDLHRDAVGADQVIYKTLTRAAGESAAQAMLVIGTGESVGQVASQTLESIACINAVVSTPILRPLACMDKVEIINMARQLGTYETSILPFEDCCTIFDPTDSVIKPKEEKCLYNESRFDFESLVEACVQNEEMIRVSYRDQEVKDNESLF